MIWIVIDITCLNSDLILGVGRYLERPFNNYLESSIDRHLPSHRLASNKQQATQLFSKSLI